MHPSLHPRRPLTLASLLLALASGPALAVQCVSPPSTKPATPARTEHPRNAEATEPAAEFKTAEELLDALETADKKIKTISAELNFTTVAGEIEGGDRQIRSGRVWFRNRTDEKPAPGQPDLSHAAASVFFEWLTLPGAAFKRVAENKTYVVDGPVMIEKIASEKLVNRFTLNSGAPQDPLKLGEGPFPLPFGQKKDEVLARFGARLAAASEGMEEEPKSLQQRLAATYQLVLTPKKEAGVSSNVKEIRVWYQKKDLLPTLARIIRPDGGFDEFFLIAMQVNKPLPANVFDTSVPKGWRVQEKEKP